MNIKNKQRHEEVYEKIVLTLDIKFKSQLKDSPIEFYNFDKLYNLVTNEEKYSITFANKESIQFRDKNEFIKEFMNYINCKIIEFEEKFEELNGGDFGGLKYDENDIFMENEYIGHGIYKLNQIFNKLKIFKI